MISVQDAELTIGSSVNLQETPLSPETYVFVELICESLPLNDRESAGETLPPCLDKGT